jgi:hypothetical protein
MKKIFGYLTLLISSIASGQNLYPTTGNVKIFSANGGWSEGISIVRPEGWSGVRFTRNDPSGGNFSGNWAIGYNASTQNDFSISTNYLGNQYDGLLHISNTTRNVGIGTTNPVTKFQIDVNDPETNISNISNSLFLKNNSQVNNNLNAISFGDAWGWGIAGMTARVKNIGTHTAELSFWARKNGAAPAAQMTLTENGDVGIGTTIPQAKLDVDISDFSSIALSLRSSSTQSRASGTLSFSSTITSAPFYIYSYDNELQFSQRNANGTYKSHFMVFNNASGNVYFPNSTGNVGIGTSSPDAKLAVKGTVHANEVKVDLLVPGPDYVFEKSYALPTLEEVKNYIDQNKHLPEIPSAKEMEANGVNVGEMNMLLLKKIEELTLHLIKQNNEIILLKEQNAKIIKELKTVNK